MTRSKSKLTEQAPSSPTRENRKMSLELKVNTNVKTSIDFIKNNVVSNLLSAKGQGKFEVSERDFQTICNIVEMSFDQGSIGAFKNTQSLVNEIKKDYGS